MDKFHIISLFIGSILTLLGATIAHIFSERRDRRNDLNKAANEFRNAFLPEVIFLKHNAKINGGSSSDLGEFLGAAYIRQLKALMLFKTYLSTKDEISIDKAWQEYCYHPDNPNIPFFEQYSWKVANKGKGYEKQLKALALNRIEKILKFAKPK
jgi:hypothetical protein